MFTVARPMTNTNAEITDRSFRRNGRWIKRKEPAIGLPEHGLSERSHSTLLSNADFYDASLSVEGQLKSCSDTLVHSRASREALFTFSLFYIDSQLIN